MSATQPLFLPQLTPLIYRYGPTQPAGLDASYSIPVLHHVEQHNFSPAIVQRRKPVRDP